MSVNVTHKLTDDFLERGIVIEIEREYFNCFFLIFLAIWREIDYI